MRVSRQQVHKRVTVGTVVFAAALCSSPALAQSRLYVEAYDRQSGAIVTDLREAEVVVLEGGSQRRVLSVRLANLPVKLAVVVDNSQATSRAFDRVKDGLVSFIDGQSQGQEIALLTLAPEPRWVVSGTLDGQEAQTELDGISVARDETGRLIDGLVEATGWLSTESELQRPVLVVVSADGPDRSPDLTAQFESLIQRLHENEVTAHAVVMTTPAPGSFERRMSVAEALGRDLARFTGGTFAAAFLGAELDEQLGDIALSIRARNRELARQHLVRFERPVGEPTGALQVNITRFGARYFVTADGAARSAPLLSTR